MTCEEWRDISGYDGAYQVSSLGRVRSSDRLDSIGRRRRGGVLSAYDNGKGYLQVALFYVGERNVFKVHRLVAEAFIPNPAGKVEVNHLDEDKANNCVFNLEWCTRKENMNHGTLNERRVASVSKPVKGTSLDGSDELFFTSVIATKDFGFNPCNISLCCNGKGITHKGYTWEFTMKEELK